MGKFNMFLKNNKYNILIIYLFMQPILDLTTSLFINVFEINFTIGIVFRLLFLILLTYYFFFIDKIKNKKRMLIYLSITFIYIISFVLEILYLKGFNSLNYEIQNLFRCFYFPISLVLLLSFLKNTNFNIDNSIIKKIFLIYILLIFIPTVTNTGFNGYTQGKVGSIGWFNSSNEISAIISLLLPLFIYEIINGKNIIINIFELLIALYVIFNLGSKIVILSLGIILFYYFIKLIIKWINNKKYKNIGILSTGIILVSVLGILVVPKTNFYKNIETHLDFLEVDNISSVFTDYKLFDHFVFSSRLTFMSNTYNNYVDSNISEKILGIGYIEKYGTDDVSLKTIEMDPFDIFFRHGIIGFIIYFIPFILCIGDIFKRRKNINNNYLLLIVISIILMNLSGHVIVSPAVSIYLSVFLAYLCKNRVLED